MNYTTATVLRYFLEKLLSSNDNEIDSFFNGFFTKEEVIQMLIWLYGKPIEHHLKIDSMTTSELLDYLGNSSILRYFIEKWDTERKESEVLTQKSVIKLLHQLCLHTHYLAEKPIEKWDSYDKSNYRSLQLKAGVITRVYGIYNSDVKQENTYKVDSPPARFYDFKEQAMSALDELIASGSLYSKRDSCFGTLSSRLVN